MTPTPATPTPASLWGGIALRLFPIFSIAAVVVPAVLLLLFPTFPTLETALNRNPTAILQGEWWRLLTALVVDSDGWGQWIAVSAGFIAIGIPVEREQGRGWWLLLFLAGGLLGEGLSYATGDYASGTSNALCGIIGGWCVARWRDDTVPLIPSFYAMGLLAALVCQEIVAAVGGAYSIGSVAATLVNAAFIQIVVVMVRQGVAVRRVLRFVTGVVISGAVILILMADLHGPALLLGVAITMIVATVRRSEGTPVNPRLPRP